MGRRPSFTAILKSGKVKCKKCGTQDNLSINHKIPLASGGTNDADNLEILCRKCHDEYHGTNKSKGMLR